VRRLRRLLVPQPAHPIVTTEPKWPPPETPPKLDELLYAMRRENDWPKRELASAHAEAALDRKLALMRDYFARQVTASAQTTASMQGIAAQAQEITAQAQEITAQAQEITAIALRIETMLVRKEVLETVQSKPQRAVDQSLAEWERLFKEGFLLGKEGRLNHS
jgi:hypothetical protein